MVLLRVRSASGRKRSVAASYIFFFFAFLIFLSGIFCFVLEKNWVRGLRPGVKVPMYLVLGIALCCALTFLAADILNSASARCCGLGSHARPLLGSAAQIVVLIVASTALGAWCG